MAKLLRTRTVQHTVTAGEAGQTQIDVTINPGYEPIKTIVTRSYIRREGDGAYDNIMVTKIDANTIRFESNQGFSTDDIVSLFLIEFESGVTVQDVVSPPATLAISQVDLAKSFIVYLGNLHSTSEQDTSQECSTCRFISDSQIQIDYDNGTYDCSFQVVEWDGCAAAQYMLVGAGSQTGLTQIDVGINAVDPARAIVHAHMTTPNSEDTGAIVLLGEFVVDLDGLARTVRFRRNRIGDISGMQATMFVLEFKDGTQCERIADVAMYGGETTKSASYPTFDGSGAPADEVSYWPVANNGQHQMRNYESNNNKDPQTVVNVTAPVSEGSNIGYERRSTANNCNMGLWAIWPSVTGISPSSEEAYPGLTEERIEEILDETFYTEPWDLADTAMREKALKAAGVAIDRLNFMGTISDSAESPHQFPRGDDTEVPYDIHAAIVNEAILLLDGADPQMEHENIGITSQGYGGTRSTHHHDATQQHTLAGIMSLIAWRYLVPYLRRIEDMNLRRGS